MRACAQRGPTWRSRGGKFAFNADRKSGYYLGKSAFGSFAADPATGALSGFSSINCRRVALELDPVNGTLFLGGAAISSFKTPAAVRK
jgi:hypothetical protein